jgi:hypothetical protein
MPEAILDNLGIIVLIVLALGGRALQSWAKAKKRQNAPPPEEVFASALEPDEDDGEDNVGWRSELADAEALAAYAQTRGASAHAAEKARTLLERLQEEKAETEKKAGALIWPEEESTARFSAPPSPPAANAAVVVEENAPAAPVFPALKPSSPLPEQKASPHPAGLQTPAPLLPGMEKLSALQQAVVWAEVLGPPRGTV